MSFADEQGLQEPTDDSYVCFGSTVTFRYYTTKESIKWGAEFLFSPATASDRQILFAYNTDQLDVDFFSNLSAIAAEKDLKIALIAKLSGGSLPLLGNERVMYGAPVLRGNLSNSQFAELISKMGDKRTQPDLKTRVGGIIAISAMKSVGLSPSTEFAYDVFDQPDYATPYIATNYRIDTLIKPEYLFGSAAAWDVGQLPRGSVWAASVKSPSLPLPCKQYQ